MDDYIKSLFRFCMHLITRPKLMADAEKYSEDVQTKVKTWCDVVKKAEWQHLEDVRKVYPSADQVENFLVFNLKDYRLIVGINYQSKTVFYKYFLTHEEYDKEKWKKDPYYK